MRLDQDKLEKRLCAHLPADRVELTVFRGDHLRTLTVVLGRRPPRKLKLEKRKTAAKALKALYAGWMGEKY